MVKGGFMFHLKFNIQEGLFSGAHLTFQTHKSEEVI